MSAIVKRLIIGANATQKAFIFGIVLFFIGGIFLHNPLSGYSSISKEVRTTVPCSKEEMLAQREIMVANLRAKNYQFGESSPWKSIEEWADAQGPHCRVPGVETVFLPFDSWRSSSPVHWWFGYVQNLFTYLIAVLLVGVAGIFLFKPENKASSELK